MIFFCVELLIKLLRQHVKIDLFSSYMGQRITGNKKLMLLKMTF